MVIVMDPTYMTYDDAGYTAFSSDVLATDFMFITDPITGFFTQISFRVIQTSLLFPAYITRMTGMPVTLVERTFSYVVNLLVAYGCYVYLAEDLYPKRENRFIFLIILSTVYIFGYHSHYSMTFRLLGPNSQGKAILAVTLVPMLFVLMAKCGLRAGNRGTDNSAVYLLRAKAVEMPVLCDMGLYHPGDIRDRLFVDE